MTDSIIIKELSVLNADIGERVYLSRVQMSYFLNIVLPGGIFSGNPSRRYIALQKFLKARK